MSQSRFAGLVAVLWFFVDPDRDAPEYDYAAWNARSSGRPPGYHESGYSAWLNLPGYFLVDI